MASEKLAAYVSPVAGFVRFETIGEPTRVVHLSRLPLEKLSENITSAFARLMNAAQIEKLRIATIIKANNFFGRMVVCFVKDLHLKNGLSA